MGCFTGRYVLLALVMVVSQACEMNNWCWWRDLGGAFARQNQQLFVGSLKSLTLDHQKDCPVKSCSLMHAVHLFSETDFFL